MLHKFTTSLSEGGGSVPSAALFQDLRKADVFSLHLTSKKKDVEKMKASFWGVNPDHTIVAELTWRKAKLEEFGVYGTGKTSDEAIRRALSVFYTVFPSGKIQGETENV